MARIIDRSINSEVTKKRGGLSGFCGFCSLIMILVLLFIGFVGFTQTQNYTQFATSKTKNTSPVEFEVKSGETVRDITKRLIDAGIIEEKNVLFVPTSEIFLQLQSVNSTNIQAGKHTIPPQTPLTEVYSFFQLKECDQVRVTFKEGLRIEEYAAKVELALNGKPEKKFSSSDFVNYAKNYDGDVDTNFTVPKNLEGYLFPDTYDFCVDVTAKQVVDRLVKTFDDKVYAEINLDLYSKELNLADIVTKASLVEREAFNNDERKVIAGIIENRLEQGMVLGIDASSQYSAGYSQKEGTWWPKGNDFLNQLQKDEPYNLRKRAGLPPTPISNPSLNSVKAVINPTDTDYFYYLHNDCGGIHYAKTLDQHNVNKNRYIGTGRC